MKSKDVWAAGEFYESYVGRWSRLVAKDFLAWLEVPPQQTWLDLGCGTSALTQAILENANPRAITAIDSSSEFIEYAKAHTADSRASFSVADAQLLPVATQVVDIAVTGLVLNFVPQPMRAVTEMARIVRPGGIVAAYVWDYGEKMELIRYFWDAAVALDPTVSALDEGRRFPICESRALAAAFSEAALRDVEVRPVDVSTQFRDFDDYWSPFLGGQGPAPGYAMSLSEERRAALRERIRLNLPIANDGSIHLVARAWAVRGRTQ